MNLRFALASSDHVEPFHAAANVRASADPSFPTARQRVVVGQLTSTSSGVTPPGVVNCRSMTHFVPVQRSTIATFPPWKSSVPQTAKHLAADVHPTPRSRPPKSPAGSAAATIVHFWPFQRIASGCGTPLCAYSPTAKQVVGLVHVMS